MEWLAPTFVTVMCVALTTLPGPTTGAANPCAGHSCSTHQVCEVVSGTPECKCDYTYSGASCETQTLHPGINCSASPCLNEQPCVTGDQGDTCVCQLPYTGRLCESTNETCETRDCYTDGGSCNNSSTSGTTQWQCVCKQGYSGNFCQLKQKFDCLDVETCLNGGTCIIPSSLGGYCYCAEGFHGRRCKEGQALIKEPNTGGGAATPTGLSVLVLISFLCLIVG